MKLSKMTLIFLLVGVFLLVGASLGVMRTQQAKQEQEVIDKLTQTRQKLALIRTDDLEAQKDQITSQIEDYNSRIDSALSALVVPADNIAATQTIIQAAQNFGVTIINISSAGESPTNSKTLPGTSMPLNLTVEGTVVSISSFVMDLSRRFPTGTVTSVQIENPADPEDDTKPANANISITIFSYGKGE